MCCQRAVCCWRWLLQSQRTERTRGSKWAVTKGPWLFRVYRGLYYPVMWRLNIINNYKGSLLNNQHNGFRCVWKSHNMYGIFIHINLVCFLYDSIHGSYGNGCLNAFVDNVSPRRSKESTPQRTSCHLFCFVLPLPCHWAVRKLGWPKINSMGFSGTPKDMGHPYGNPYYSHSTPIFESLKIWE